MGSYAVTQLQHYLQLDSLLLGSDVSAELVCTTFSFNKYRRHLSTAEDCSVS
jgi:hypothetical protein